MKNKFLLVLVIIIVFAIVALTRVRSLQEPSSIKLVKGRNLIMFNVSGAFYAEDLIKLNPEIETISYEDSEKSFGYLNILDGIGKNFIIENESYEIFVSKNTTLILPDSGG